MDFETSPLQTGKPVVQQNSNLKYIVITVVVAALALCGMAGVYVWQHKQVSDAEARNAALGAQLASANNAQEAAADKSASDSEKASTNPAASYQIVPGQVDFDENSHRGQADMMYVDAYVKPSDDLKEIWLEYGTNPAALNLQTAHITQELGLGDAGNYGNFAFTIKKSSLTPGVDYFYRVAYKTGTTTSYTSIAAFTSPK